MTMRPTPCCWSSDQAGKVVSPARGQLNRENEDSLSPFVPDNLVSQDGFGHPVPRGQILRRKRGQKNINFPCSADHEHWNYLGSLTQLIHTLLCVMTINTYSTIQTKYFPCSPTTSRIGSLTQLIHTLLCVMTINTYSTIQTKYHCPGCLPAGVDPTRGSK